MPRILAILLCAWRTDRVRRHLRARVSREASTGHTPAARELAILSHRPILVTAEVSGATRIVDACHLALARSVRIGMSLAHGRALCEGLAIESRVDESADRMALRQLARWCQRWSPTVAVDDGGGRGGHTHALLLDATGVAHLMGGEAMFLRRVRRSLTQREIRVRVALAPTPRAALAAAGACAGSSTPPIIPTPDDIRPMLRDAPLEPLRLEPPCIAALHEVNLRHIGELFALPRSDLLVRFGAGLLDALDRLDGSRPERLDGVREEPPPEHALHLESPDPRQDSLWRVLDLVLDGLCNDLRRRHRRMREVELLIERYHMPTATMRLSMSAATDDPRHVARLLRPRLEKLDLGVMLGLGMESMRVRALRLARPRNGLWLGEGRGLGEGLGDGLGNGIGADIGALVDTLAARLGREHVRRIVPMNRHAPDHAWRMMPADAPAGGRAHASCGGGAGDPRAHPRPTSLLQRPESITVGMRGMVPESFRWRGREIALRHSIGPERLAAEWWNRARGVDATVAALQSRDLWRVQADDGGWFLLERGGAGSVGGGGGGDRAWHLRGAWC